MCDEIQQERCGLILKYQNISWTHLLKPGSKTHSGSALSLYGTNSIQSPGRKIQKFPAEPMGLCDDIGDGSEIHKRKRVIIGWKMFFGLQGEFLTAIPQVATEQN